MMMMMMMMMMMTTTTTMMQCRSQGPEVSGHRGVWGQKSPSEVRGRDPVGYGLCLQQSYVHAQSAADKRIFQAL